MAQGWMDLAWHEQGQHEIGGQQANPVELSSGKKVAVDTRGPQDMQNISALAQMARARINASDQTQIYFRGADNITHTLTPLEMTALENGVGAFTQKIYACAWALKDRMPEMMDISDEKYWKQVS